MIAAVAGTFNILHRGHRALLEHAFSVADHVFVGITSDAMAAGGREKVLPLYLRRAALVDYLNTLGNYTVFVIDDIYGPNDIMDNAEVLVVSEETRSNALLVNERRSSRGVPELRIEVVPLIVTDNGDKISASAILRGEYGREGRRDIMHVAVGSANSVKVEAVRSVMERVYGDVRVTGYDVDSGVPPQPFGDQTHQGAVNRARACIDGHDLAVGIEAGVFDILDGLYDIQHCCIVSKDGRETYGQGPGFRYPDTIADLVHDGMTVGDAVHSVYGDTDIGKKQGAIGLLSKGLLDRKALTEQSVIAAMVPRLYGE